MGETRERGRVWTVRLCILELSLVYGFGVLFAVGIISGWGRWYSFSPIYSAQADALLQGRLALSQNIADLDCDLAWSQGGIHQVWGLGIPCLRLPLAALAHLCKWGTFPEHLATGLAFSAAAFLVLTSLVEPAILRRRSPVDALPSLSCAALLLLFPPFVTMLRARFLVYEEAMAHAYLFGIIEGVLLFQFLRKPSRGRWIGLMALAGFGPFVRPPLVFYGFAAWLIGTWQFFRLSNASEHSTASAPPTADRSRQSAAENGKAGLGFRRALLLARLPLRLVPRVWTGTWIAGTSIFIGAALTLMAANWLRFGHPREFGYLLNVTVANCDGATYATKFDHPFRTAPLPDVLKELPGWLFFAKPQRDPVSWYEPGLFWGQAKAARLREFYFSACDWTYLAMLIAVAAVVAYWVNLWFRRRLPPHCVVPMMIGVWCLVSLVPLCKIYLRMPAISSRYALDFGPGFAVLMAGGWYVLLTWLTGKRRLAGVLLLGVWVGGEITSARCAYKAWPSPSRQELASRPTFGQPQRPQKALVIGSQTEHPGSSGIPFDGTGWDKQSGNILPVVTVFVAEPKFLEIELARAPQAAEDPDPAWVRAKIGLEILEREYLVRDGDVWHMRFRGPKRAAYQKGIQTAFIASVPNTRLTEKRSPWILRRVRWRN